MRRVHVSTALAAGGAILVGVAMLYRPPRGGPRAGGSVVVVAAASSVETPARSPVPAATATSTSAAGGLEAEIARDLHVPASTLSDVRMVDAERRIACGSRTIDMRGGTRRFVWISRLATVVTDDGGPDFANLATICEAP